MTKHPRVLAAAMALVLAAAASALNVNSHDRSAPNRVHADGGGVPNQAPDDTAAAGATTTQPMLNDGVAIETTTTSNTPTTTRKSSMTTTRAVTSDTTVANTRRCASATSDRIAFIDIDRQGEPAPLDYVLKIYDFGTGQSTQVGVNTSFYPVWSSDGCELVVEDHGRITRITAEGTRTVSPAGVKDTWPSMSPDLRYIAFVNDTALWVMNADGTNRKRLVALGTANYLASWSPDSRRIAFEASTTSGNEIFTISPDGSAQTQLTHSPQAAEEPQWSPDGAWIGFTIEGQGYSPDDVGNVVYALHPDGSGVKKLSQYPSRGSWGWSADSSRVVAGEQQPSSNNADGPREIRITTVATGVSREYPMTSPASGATFAPSATMVVYSGACDGHTSSLCALDVGTGATHLLVDYAGTGRPAFAPR